MRSRFLLALAAALLVAAAARANPPAASYIFPAGGQRGTTVNVRVGGLFLHSRCGFEMLGTGVKATSLLKRTDTLWFEGPLLPLPDSQQAEDYPKDMAGMIQIDKAAAPGQRHWRLWTSQGATPSMPFMVGDFPEVIEEEIDGDPIPVKVSLPVTINGRIFPREDVDIWSFHALRGQGIRCEVHAARLGSPLDARLEIRDSNNRRLAESEGRGPDPFVRFVAPAEGDYQVHIHDVRFQGGQAFVYRLTITNGPWVEHFYPLGGKRGSTLKVQTAGLNLNSTSVDLALPNSPAKEYVHRIPVGNDLRLELDDLPEYVAVEPHDNMSQAKAVQFPAVLNGRIRGPGDVDCWTWTGRKGDKLVFDLRAGRLGSPLDGMILVHDAADKELARAEISGPDLDPVLRFTVPADGKYQVRVKDRFRSRGGPEFAYRLRVGPPEPADFRLCLASDALTLPRKGDAHLKISADRLGDFKEPIAISVDGLPSGVTVHNAVINAGQNAVDLQLKADATVAIKPAHLTFRGQGKLGKETVTRTARILSKHAAPEIDSVLLAPALPTPFQIKGEYSMGFCPRGTVHRRRYKITRDGYSGPIAVSLADRQARHLQGVQGPTVVVSAGATEFIYSAMLPPWMETGRTCRVCVMGVAVIDDGDGARHEVSFSSVHQNEQLVTVIAPGRLAVELERTTVTVAPGKTLSVPLHVKRGQGLSGPVKVELIVPRHIHGLSATPHTIPADQSAASLTIHCSGDLRGPINMPMLIRAALLQDGQPFLAESKFEIALP